MSDNNTMTNIPSSPNQATVSVANGTPVANQPIVAQPSSNKCPVQPDQTVPVQQQQTQPNQAQAPNLQADYAQAKATVNKTV